MKTTATEWGHSRWASLERCPREYHLRYDLGIISLETRSAADIGIAFHRGLASYYGCLRNLWYHIAEIDAGYEAPFDKAEAKRLFDAYVRYWGDHADWQSTDVVAVEHHVKAKIGEATFTTRLDLVVKDIHTRSITIVDHKTTAASRGDFLAEHYSSSQFVGAALALPAAWKPKGFARKPIEVPVILNRAIRTNHPSFDRHSFVVTTHQQERFKRDLVLLNQDRHRYETEGYWPRHRSSCQGRYGLCQFYALCHQGGQVQAANYKIPKGVDLNEALR